MSVEPLEAAPSPPSVSTSDQPPIEDQSATLPVTVSDSPAPAGNSHWARYRLAFRDTIQVILLIVAIYTLVNLATSRAVVEGQSMQPNFDTGQFVIVNRFIYYFTPPQRGDVIVLHDPQDPTQDFIKRVIGLPNEVIDIRGGRVYVNGKEIAEPYIGDFCASHCDGDWMLKNDEYFVLGDNRNNSFDSHSFGPISRNLIVGQAWIRYWPPQDIGIIAHPQYRQDLSVPSGK